MEMNVAHSEDFARSLLCRRRTGILVRSVRSHQIWSNGQTEIEIADLKLVKCQMYERARLDLRRAIPMPPCNHRINCTSGSRILRGGRGGIVRRCTTVRIAAPPDNPARSEEPTSDLQFQISISYPL